MREGLYMDVRDHWTQPVPQRQDAGKEESWQKHSQRCDVSCRKRGERGHSNTDPGPPWLQGGGEVGCNPWENDGPTENRLPGTRSNIIHCRVQTTCQYFREGRDQGGGIPKGQSKPSCSPLSTSVPVILPLPTCLSVLPAWGSQGDSHSTLCQSKLQCSGLFRADLQGPFPCSLRRLCISAQSQPACRESPERGLWNGISYWKQWGVCLIFLRPSVQFSHAVMSNSLWPHGLQHARLPCPSPTPEVYSNSCPLSQWCHPTISSSAIPFSSCLQSFSSIRVFSNESVLRIKWPEYWSFSFSISPSNEHSGLISFRIDWLDLLAAQVTLKSLLQHHNSKASILQRSAFFIVQLSHPYMTTRKTIILTRWTFVGKVMSLLFKICCLVWS